MTVTGKASPGLGCEEKRSLTKALVRGRFAL
jgi:hypothetical protein